MSGNLGAKLREYCVIRTIRNGKREKVYNMLTSALMEDDKIKGYKLLKRASRIIERDIYGFVSRSMMGLKSVVISAYIRPSDDVIMLEE